MVVYTICVATLVAWLVAWLVANERRHSAGRTGELLVIVDFTVLSYFFDVGETVHCLRADRSATRQMWIYYGKFC